MPEVQENARAAVDAAIAKRQKLLEKVRVASSRQSTRSVSDEMLTQFAKDAALLMQDQDQELEQVPIIAYCCQTPPNLAD